MKTLLAKAAAIVCLAVVSAYFVEKLHTTAETDKTRHHSVHAGGRQQKSLRKPVNSADDNRAMPTAAASRIPVGDASDFLHRELQIKQQVQEWLQILHQADSEKQCRQIAERLLRKHAEQLYDPNTLHQVAGFLIDDKNNSTAAGETLLVKLLLHWGEFDPIGLRNWMAGRIERADNNIEIIENSFIRLVRQSPEQACALAEHAAFNGRLEWLTRRALVEHAKTDPEFALEQLKHLSPKQQALGTVEMAKSLARETPLAAADLFQLLPESSAKFSAAGELAGVLMVGGEADRAQAIVDQLPDNWKKNAWKQMIGHWVDAEPADAAQWLADTHADPGDDALLGTALVRWTHRQPRAAAAWAAKQPSDLRERSLRTISETLAMEQPNAAMQLLADIPEDQRPPGLFEEVENCIILTAARENPQQASTILPPERMRENTRRVLVREWLRRNPQEAADWVGELAVSRDDEQISDSELSYLSCNVVGALTEHVPDQAHAWLNTLPEGVRKSTRSRLKELRQR